MGEVTAYVWGSLKRAADLTRSRPASLVRSARSGLSRGAATRFMGLLKGLANDLFLFCDSKINKTKHNKTKNKNKKNNKKKHKNKHKTQQTHQTQ